MNRSSPHGMRPICSYCLSLPLTHLCSSDHSSASPHRRHRVCGCSVPCKQVNTQALCPFSSKFIMTHSPHFSQWGRFLEALEVNAKLAGFSSSLHMQSASCVTFEPEIHETPSIIKPRKAGTQYCELSPESLDMKGASD